MAAKKDHTYVLGLGRSGMAVATFLKGRGCAVRVWDDGADLRQQATSLGLDVGLWDVQSPAGSVVVSPGIADHPLLGVARDQGWPILGDLQLFVRLFPSVQAVAVTGSNGKSTTCTLLAHALGHLYRHTIIDRRPVLAGNIGTPVFATLGPEGSPAPDALYVLEVSSYQLESIERLPVLAAAVTNLTPHHLERHKNLQAYAALKLSLCRHADVCVVGQDLWPWWGDQQTRASRQDLSGDCQESAPLDGQNKLFSLGEASMASGTSSQHVRGLAIQSCPGCQGGGMLPDVLREGRHEERLSDANDGGGAHFQSSSHSGARGLVQGIPAGLDTVECQDCLLNRWGGVLPPGLNTAHSRQNVACALAVLQALVPGGDIRQVPQTVWDDYTGLPHRQERLVTQDGIVWINDSKATSPAAITSALASAPTDGPLCLIVGGVIQKDDLAVLAKGVHRVAYALCIGSSGPRYHAFFQSQAIESCICTTLDLAVDHARLWAQRQQHTLSQIALSATSVPSACAEVDVFASSFPQPVVLFSPGCASFDQFKDFEHRGDTFRTFAQHPLGCAVI